MIKTGLYLIVIILAVTLFEEYIAKGGVTKSGGLGKEGKKFCKKSKCHRQNRDLDFIKSGYASNSKERIRHPRDCKLFFIVNNS